MQKEIHLLKKKIEALREKCREKDRLLNTYRQALGFSNSRIQKIMKNLNQNLILVRNIHKHILPVRLPRIPGFEFSYKFLPTKKGVSGDFFDVVKIQDSTKFCILISSCSSYALTSLFLSSFLEASPNLKNYKKAEDFLSFIMKKISDSLVGKEKIHLCYGIVSRPSMEMDFCLVGDIFVGHKSSLGKVNILSSGEPQLKKEKKLLFKGGKISLEKGDLLLFCSPGVAERKNKKDKAFGVKNITKILGKRNLNDVLELRQELLFACEEFSGHKEAKKDCTVLSVKVAGNFLKLKSF